MDVDARLLQYFVTLADELHFGRAAARLYVSQPALSKQLRVLEEGLRLNLFTRTRRQVTLTPAGAALSAHSPNSLSQTPPTAHDVSLDSSETPPSPTLCKAF